MTTAHTSPSAAPGARIMVNTFDGTRKAYSDQASLLVTVADGNHRIVSQEYHDTPSAFFTGLQVFNNFGDDYTVLVSASGYKDAGFFPVHVASNVVQIVDLMLIPKHNEINFAGATWAKVKQLRPQLATLFRQGAGSEDAAAARYSDVEEQAAGEWLACLLNITSALDQIHLPIGTALDYFRTVVWDRLAPDRFFAFADAQLIDQVKSAASQGLFEAAPFVLHPGATGSFKQIQFGEANVQLTFHENDRQTIGSTDCIVVESDIDYFRDPASHLLLEVAVNAFGSITDPRAVYALRWVTGRRAGIPEFDPLYTIQKA
jgi:hypothetical protein